MKKNINVFKVAKTNWLEKNIKVEKEESINKKDNKFSEKNKQVRKPDIAKEL